MSMLHAEPRQNLLMCHYAYYKMEKATAKKMAKDNMRDLPQT